MCVAHCKQAGHLGSVGDDNIDSSKEENHKKVKAKRKRPLEQRMSKITEKITRWEAEIQNQVSDKKNCKEKKYSANLHSS